MRPQQQNRRMRGRGGGGQNNQNRRGPNPLTRSYESNGPDVKIRGTAQQIADKYATLARDAQSSGDRVMAENYLQHAEHYNRIIAAAQAQQAQQTQREQRIEIDDDSDEDFDPPPFLQAPQANQPQNRNQQANDGSGPQPVIEGTPAEVALEQNAMNGSNGHDHDQANGPRRQRRRPDNGGEQDQDDGQQASGETGEDGEGPRKRGRRPRRNNRGRDGEQGGEDDAAPRAASAGADVSAAEQPD
ncbi:MAG: DUF4167 domain-containing protein [Rhizobiaceae bacterium]|nr:DUF4167 domain-containing protein [Rhizobiaceae bacterium]MCV0408339.1 DUF4167 domain-containing protein [Rhizobiaceae bacterium]